MLAELDFIAGDWAALWWALGGAGAIVRGGLLELGRDLLAWVDVDSQRWRERAMEQKAKKAGLLVLGAVGTAALILVSFGLLYGAAVAFPSLGLDKAEWTHVLMIVVIPMAISAVAVVWLWRRKRPVAIGIMLTAVVLLTHVAHHFVHR